ncbi:MAG: FAD-dependent oxidoreductase, partial [Thermomicrobiales bacterium]
MNEAIGPPPAQADVVVYGATASGVVAAVAAAHLGRRVIVVEPGQ